MYLAINTRPGCLNKHWMHNSILAYFSLLYIFLKGTLAAECTEAIINLSRFHVSHHGALKRFSRAIFFLFVISVLQHIMIAKICIIFPIHQKYEDVFL